MKEYLVYDADGLVSVSCMNCGTKIAGRNKRVRNGQETYKLVHYNNSRKRVVDLEDGTYAELMVCNKCSVLPSIDTSEMDLTIHWGWMQELNHKIEKYEHHPKKKQIFEKYGMEDGDSKPPLSFYKSLFGGKRIQEKGK
jgi:hypothetical protein